ncbi:MAG: HAAS signaling domain-containing protein [Fimbriimonadaceae bacterium]
MARYIEWYLAELERRLGRLVSRERMHEILCDAESHLREKAEALEREGMDPRAAQLAAVEAFGRPDRVAAAELRAQRARIFGLPTPWALGTASLLPFLALGYVAIANQGGRLPDETPFLFALLCLPFLVASALAGRAVGRPLAAAMVVGYAVFAVASSLALVRHEQLSVRGLARKEAEESRKSAERSERLAEVLREGRRAFFLANTPEEAPKAWRADSPEAGRILREVGASDPALFLAPVQNRGSQQQARPRWSFLAPIGSRVVFANQTQPFVPSLRARYVQLRLSDTESHWVIFEPTTDFRTARTRWLLTEADEEAARGHARASRERASRIEAALARRVQLHGSLLAQVGLQGFLPLGALLGLLGEAIVRLTLGLRMRRVGWA